jgi:hypothetical protein
MNFIEGLSGATLAVFEAVHRMLFYIRQTEKTIVCTICDVIGVCRSSLT